MDMEHGGVVSPETLRTVGGLDLLRGIRDGTYPKPPIGVLMDFHGDTVEEGFVVFVGRPGPRHFNPSGMVHGGYAATLLDSAMGCAVHTLCPAGRGFTTLEIKVNYIRAMTASTGAVRAEGRVLNAGRRTAIADGRLVDGAGKLLATGTTTCLFMDL